MEDEQSRTVPARNKPIGRLSAKGFRSGPLIVKGALRIQLRIQRSPGARLAVDLTRSALPAAAITEVVNRTSPQARKLGNNFSAPPFAFHGKLRVRGTGMADQQRTSTYHTNAADCLRMAQDATDEQKKLLLLGIAQAWMKLSDFVKKSHMHDGADGEMPPAEKAGPPVASLRRRRSAREKHPVRSPARGRKLKTTHQGR